MKKRDSLFLGARRKEVSESRDDRAGEFHLTPGGRHIPHTLTTNQREQFPEQVVILRNTEEGEIWDGVRVDLRAELAPLLIDSPIKCVGGLPIPLFADLASLDQQLTQPLQTRRESPR